MVTTVPTYVGRRCDLRGKTSFSPFHSRVRFNSLQDMLGAAMDKQAKPVVIGIDPGLDGAIATLTIGAHNEPEDVKVIKMPTIPGAKGKREVNAAALFASLEAISRQDLGEGVNRQLKFVAIELVHSMPEQGIASTFNFGCSYGKLLAALEIVGAPVERVTPQRWKKVVLDGYGREKSDAIRYVMQRFPTVSLLPTPRCKNPDDGMAEAVCIAEYARRKLVGQIIS